jgi:hypothetical protein
MSRAPASHFDQRFSNTDFTLSFATHSTTLPPYSPQSVTLPLEASAVGWTIPCPVHRGRKCPRRIVQEHDKQKVVKSFLGLGTLPGSDWAAEGGAAEESWLARSGSTYAAFLPTWRGSFANQSSVTAAVQDWSAAPRDSPTKGSKYSPKPPLAICRRDA